MSERRFIPASGQGRAAAGEGRARELRQSTWWKRRIADGMCHYCGRQVGIRRADGRPRGAADPGRPLLARQYGPVLQGLQ